MWKVDDRDGESFRDLRTRGAEPEGQLDLFQAAGLADSELLELVTQRLTIGAASVETVGEWLLTESARWLPKHAMQAARQMRQDGLIVVQSPGKLTTKSRVTLQAQVRA
ncbi:hypothetical protein ACIRRI_28170 [Streptomyces mirabilis]